MKGRRHAGFSMVELIIVIAIMAVLSAALAPMLIKYVRKARRTTDIETAGEIAKAYDRAAVIMNDEENFNGTFGLGTVYARYDTVLHTPAQTIEDFAFEELGSIPQSSTYHNYYWKIEYDPANGKVSKISLTPGSGSSENHEVYPDNEAFAEGQ